MTNILIDELRAAAKRNSLSLRNRELMAKAADALERKKGEWEIDRRGVVCTCCNGLIYIEPHILELNTLEMWWMDYCPNCGADMR